MSSLNPVAFSSAGFISAFHNLNKNSTMKIKDWHPEVQPWIDLISDSSKMETILAEAKRIGNLDSILSSNRTEVGNWSANWNMGSPGRADPGTEMYYLAVMFSFMIKWNRDVGLTKRSGEDYLSFGKLNLISKNGQYIGAHLPVEGRSSFKPRLPREPKPNSLGLETTPSLRDSNDIFAWVAMPNKAINSVKDLHTYTQEIQNISLKPRLTSYLSGDDNLVETYVPAVTLRTDLLNQPDLSTLKISSGGETGQIKESKYSYRLVLNEKGAFMRSVQKHEIQMVTACIVMPSEIPKEFVIDRDFVFAAGTRKGGVLFTCYVPRDYWNYTPGESDQALSLLDSASWGQYRPAEKNQIIFSPVRIPSEEERLKWFQNSNQNKFNMTTYLHFRIEGKGDGYGSVELTYSDSPSTKNGWRSVPSWKAKLEYHPSDRDSETVASFRIYIENSIETKFYDQLSPGSTQNLEISRNNEASFLRGRGISSRMIVYMKETTNQTSTISSSSEISLPVANFETIITKNIKSAIPLTGCPVIPTVGPYIISPIRSPICSPIRSLTGCPIISPIRSPIRSPTGCPIISPILSPAGCPIISTIRPPVVPLVIPAIRPPVIPLVVPTIRPSIVIPKIISPASSSIKLVTNPYTNPYTKPIILSPMVIPPSFAI
uniref:Sine oculis-binding protein n=1 Tax=Pithovirus LCPAC201 TaxID=2506591 RepID=A0A481Z725_9VIRU|nr:MAG: sine oculis-binding protein [Pithovirus LCPAC201]